MNEQIVLDTILRRWGLPGIFLLFVPAILHFVYDKWNDKKSYRELEKTKQEKIESGEWISGESFKRMGNDLNMLTEKVNEHSIKEAEKDIKMAKIESEVNHIKENFTEIKENQKAMFQIITEIRSYQLSHK